MTTGEFIFVFLMGAWFGYGIYDFRIFMKHRAHWEIVSNLRRKP